MLTVRWLGLSRFGLFLLSAIVASISLLTLDRIYHHVANGSDSIVMAAMKPKPKGQATTGSVAATASTALHHKLRRLDDTVVVPDHYIVILNDSVRNVTEKANALLAVSNSSCRVAHIYETTTKGFALDGCSEDQVVELLKDDTIQHAWEDALVSADSTATVSAGPSKSQSTPASLYWLDRMDQTSPPNDKQYRYKWDGANVTIFIFDTGIRLAHQEFQNLTDNGDNASNNSNTTSTRTVECGFNAMINRGEPLCNDNHGHGSFTAALAAGTTYGAAKQASIVAVRVLDRNKLGTVSAIMAGMEYVANIKKANPSQPMVINMSLSTTPRGNILGCLRQFKLFGCMLEARQETTAWLDAIEALVDLGVVVVVSAGNTLTPGVPACLSTPGRSDKVITVGGSTARNNQWLFSKSGRCVDVFAPAAGIRSAWIGSSTSSASTQSGTSASAPIVAGVAALYLQRDPTMTPAQVKQALLDDAVKGVTLRGLFSPNRLVSTVGLLEG